MPTGPLAYAFRILHHRLPEVFPLCGFTTGEAIFKSMWLMKITTISTIQKKYPKTDRADRIFGFCMGLHWSLCLSLHFSPYNTLKINLMSFWFQTFQSNFERLPIDWQLSTTYQSVLLVAADSLDDMWLCSSAPLIAGVALQTCWFQVPCVWSRWRKKNKLWQQHIWAKTCKNNEKKKQQQQLLVQILVAAPLPIFHFARGLLWSTLNGFLSTIPSRRLVLVFVTEIVHICWTNIFVLQYFSVNARLFVYMKLYVFITVYDNYTTCRWHGSCRTYPKNANSHVICKVEKKNCISPVSSVKCFGKKSHDMGLLGPVHPKNAKHVMSTNSHTAHFTSHMNKDSIWAYDYLLAVGIIQKYTSAVRIFQSHMNPFTSLFYLATI